MADRRVLIIAYHFPPLGGGGVQRTLNFVRYLPDFGWRPIVLTVENVSYPIRDESLSQLIPSGTPIIRTSTWSPSDHYFQRTRKASGEGHTQDTVPNAFPGWVRRLGHFALQATMHPDDKVGWIRPATQAGAKAIRTFAVDAIYSTTPPFSVHQTAYKLTRQTGRHWVADFRDQFVGRYNELFFSGLHRWLGRRMERRWVAAARRVISTTGRVSGDFAARYPELPAARWVTITNGYDDGDYADNRQPPETQFRLRYLGSLYRAGSPSPKALLTALANLIEKQPDLRQLFRLEFIGMRDIQASQDLDREIEMRGLQEMVAYKQPVAHDGAIAAMQSATALLLLLTTAHGAAGIIPAKTFEYLRAGRPILALVPQGEAANLVERLNAGVVAHPKNVSQIEISLGRLIDSWRRGTLTGGQQRDVAQFERRELTRHLASVLNDAIAGKYR